MISLEMKKSITLFSISVLSLDSIVHPSPTFLHPIEAIRFGRKRLIAIEGAIIDLCKVSRRPLRGVLRANATNAARA